MREFMSQTETINASEVERLLVEIQDGNPRAFNELFDYYREDLRAAMNRRIESHLNARFDASDVVQETQLEAYRRIDDFLKRRPMPFGAWIRQTALERLKKMRRAHAATKGRSVYREQRLPEKSSALIATQIVAADYSARARLEKLEYERLVHEAVDELDEIDREILLMRVVEDIPHQEIALILDVKSDAVRKRYGRALIKLERKLSLKGISRSGS